MSWVLGAQLTQSSVFRGAQKMDGRLSFPILSWLCAFAIVGFYAWITIAPFSYAAAPIVALFLLGLVLTILKLGAREPVDYWDAEPRQAGRVALMILTAVIVQFAASASLAAAGQMNPAMSMALYLGVWTAVPLIFLAIGGVRWPHRRARPRTGEFLIVAILAIGFAGALCGLQTMNIEAAQAASSPVDFMIGGGAVLLGATAEEAVYRVLLLTALIKASGSRLQALLLSSVVFALAHVPPAFSTPLALQDSGMLQFYATEFLSEMVWIIGMGFVFGALWLRTGSVTLVITFHTICNLAPILGAGLEGL